MIVERHCKKLGDEHTVYGTPFVTKFYSYIVYIISLKCMHYVLLCIHHNYAYNVYVLSRT